MSAAAILEPTDGLGPWQQFLCRACGLIYDEGEGDLDSGLPPGTRFADIPEDWECPVCGVTKADFEPYAGRRLAAPASPPAPRRARTAGIVIVGAGIAGWSVAEAIRGRAPDVPLTLVTACAGDVYHKPELSIAFSRGLAPERLRRETGTEKASRLGVRLMAETFAVGISPQRRRLRTTRGQIPYTHLILAQGARPALPASLPPDLVWRINALAGWAGLHAALRPQSRVVVVGAGMVGCEIAEDLAGAGHGVTLLDRAALPLCDLLPEPAGQRLETGLRAAGIVFQGNVTVSAVTRTAEGQIRVTGSDGTCWVADQVIAATGLATESRLARSAGLAFDRGIVVDGQTLATSTANIYALGDCITIAGAPCRFIEPIAHQAAAIANGVLGLPHDGYAHRAPVIRLKTRSLPVVVHGTPVRGAPWQMVENTPARLAMEQWRGADCLARLDMTAST